MRNSVEVVGSVVLLVLVGVVVFYLWMMYGPVASPDRPLSVPPTANWVGANKGQWVDCVVEKGGARQVRCVLYNDVKGQRISEGNYQWQPNGTDSLPEPIVATGFQADEILVGRGRLIPIGRHVYYGHGDDRWTKDYPSPPPRTAG